MLKNFQSGLCELLYDFARQANRIVRIQIQNFQAKPHYRVLTLYINFLIVLKFGVNIKLIEYKLILKYKHN